MMRGAVYKSVRIGTKKNKPKELYFLMVDRHKKRGFIMHDKWIKRIATYFKVFDLIQ